MPRINRALRDDFIYHVINRGNAKQRVFHDESDYQNFIEFICFSRRKYPIDLYAFCLMPNHIHFVLSPHKANYLPKLMQLLFTKYVRYYHKKYKSSGHIWQGRYKSFVIQDGIYLITVVRYVEGNPVRSGLSKSAIQWKWSSHRERVSILPKRLISEIDFAYPKKWTEFVDTPLTENDILEVEKCVNRQSPFGNESWVKNVCNEHGLESTIKRRGRPRGQKRGQATFSKK